MALSNLDRELIQHCLEGKSGAWKRFVDRNVGLISHVVRQCLTSRNLHSNAQDVEDLIADVFALLVKNDFNALRRFKGNSALPTYLTVITRRVVMHKISRPRYRNRLQSIDRVPEPEAPSEFLATAETREQIETAMANLSGSDADLIRLFHLEGKSYREISHHLGVPENSIGPMLSRARSRIRQGNQ